MKSEVEVKARIAELWEQWRHDSDRREAAVDREDQERLEAETVAVNRLIRELEWVMS